MYTLGIDAGAPQISDFNNGTTTISSTALGNATALLASAAGVLSTITQTFNATSQTSGYVSGAPDNRNFRENNWSLYLGDHWKMARRLTFNYGVRWEYYSPVDEKNGLVLLPVIPARQTVDRRSSAMLRSILPVARASVRSIILTENSSLPMWDWPGTPSATARRPSAPDSV